MNILKSTRIERALIPISFILLTASFANQLTSQIIILATCSTLLYISGGILNAKIDNDYPLPKSTPIIITSLILITIILSLQNKIIFATVLIWATLNIVYNKYSRKILLADSLILSLTHAVIPITATALLTNLPPILTIKIATFAFILTNLIIPIKNFNGIYEDKKRKYKTLLTKYKNGKTITTILFNLSLIPTILALLFFDLNQRYLIMLIIIIAVYLTADYLLATKKETAAYELSRLIVILITLSFTYSLNPTIEIVLAHTSLILIYAVYLVLSLKWNTTT